MEDMKNAHKMLITETKEIQVQMGWLTLNLPTTTIVAPPCKARNADDNYSFLSFGNADKALSFYLTAQCLNTEWAV